MQDKDDEMPDKVNQQTASTIGEILRMVTPILVGALGILILRVFSKADDDIKKLNGDMVKLRDENKHDNKVIHDRITANNESFKELLGEHNIICNLHKRKDDKK